MLIFLVRVPKGLFPQQFASDIAPLLILVTVLWDRPIVSRGNYTIGIRECEKSDFKTYTVST